MDKERKTEEQAENEPKEEKKEGKIMTTLAALNHGSTEYLRTMEKHIAEMRGRPKEEAEKEAREALIRTGVITKDGQAKKQIVSWE